MDESILATCLSLALNAWTAAQGLRQLCDTFGQSRRRIQDAAMRLNACHSTLTLLDWRWKMEARSMAPTHATHPDGDMSNDDLVRLWGEEGCREMQRYIQHLESLLTTAQSLIDSVTPSSETAQTRKRGPSTSRSQHSTGREQPRRYNYAFMPLFGIPPRRSSKVVRGRHNTSIISSRPERHQRAGNVRKEARPRNPGVARGARPRWTVSIEEDMRQALTDIDGWLKRIKDLAKEYKTSQGRIPPAQSSPSISTASGQSGSTSNRVSFTIGNASPSRVREHGEVLHRALTNALRRGMGLFLRLERNHTDPASFAQFASATSYLENEGKTSKFLILVSDRESPTPYPLMAHVYPNLLRQTTRNPNTMNYHTISARQTLHDMTLHDILDGLEPNSSTGMSTPVAIYKDDKVIVLHRVRRNTTKLPQSVPLSHSSSIFDLAPRVDGNQLDIFRSHKTRVSVATTMAHSVLQLQETGWLPQHLSLNDFYYHAGHNQPGSIDVWLSPLESGSYETTPFECIHDAVYSTQLTDERDRRLSATYHRLGIALLELGHGRSYRQILRPENDDNGNDQQRLEDIHTAINTIDLGRSYQDVVRLCLTGRLLQGREVGLDVDVDAVFGEMVLRRLQRLENALDEVIVSH